MGKRLPCQPKHALPMPLEPGELMNVSEEHQCLQSTGTQLACQSSHALPMPLQSCELMIDFLIMRLSCHCAKRFLLARQVLPRHVAAAGSVPALHPQSSELWHVGISIVTLFSHDPQSFPSVIYAACYCSVMHTGLEFVVVANALGHAQLLQHCRCHHRAL